MAKAILRWVICAIRPMSVAELRTAVRLDTNRTLKKSKEAIEFICQPLVSVNNDRVEVVHDTVRHYLFNSNKDRISGSEALSDFFFDRGASHEQTAIICLAFLTTSLRTPARRISHDEISHDDDLFLGQSLAYQPSMRHCDDYSCILGTNSTMDSNV